MCMTVGDIAQLVGGTVAGDSSLPITGVNGIKEAQAGDLTFVRSARYLPLIFSTKASAVLIAEQPEGKTPSLILCSQPDLAFAQVLQCFSQRQTQHPSGIHPTAVIGENVILGQDVALDAHVYITSECEIGARTVIYPGVYIGRRVKIGEDTVIYPNVVLREDTEIGSRCILHAGAVLGSDGFGFAPLAGQWMKIPQIGRVVVEDDVEIGSNTTIDRATFGVTRIRRGTKIDNLVQIGHNVEIGEHCALAGMVGVSGSVMIGNHVQLGAGVGIAGHIDIGEKARVGARSGVHKSVAPGAIVSGYPAIEHEKFLRVVAVSRNLPEWTRRVRQLERQVEALEKQLLHE
ncbi:MAG TPA: UDP-3-O-(3-hydroxymyristoyl)glucosamine N-acyltransferase [Candidatus Hydrogenedentes bacterium]|nr:UDP-3-O-(3-hydroxymyristoyl)glucosamine N-acyltransferase [Candidatus Hydrogenedentota bacterium]